MCFIGFNALWTVSTIFLEHGVKSANSRACVELLLHNSGLRVDSLQHQGFFSK
jgi:hypothetical protein